MPRACPVETHARGYKESCATLPDATGLPRGVSRLWLLVTSVWASAISVSLHATRRWPFLVAASVRLHGARPWHQFEFSHDLGSDRVAAILFKS